MDNNPTKVLIGTTTSSGEFALWVVINNEDEVFGAPGMPTLNEVISTLTGMIAKNISINQDIDFDQAFNDVEVHTDCGFTSAQVPDLLDQFSRDDETFCESGCADHTWTLAPLQPHNHRIRK